MASGRELMRQDLYTWRVCTAVFLPPEWVLTGSEKPYTKDPKPLRLWNFVKNRMHMIPDIDKGVQALVVVPEGRLALSSGADHLLRLWEMPQVPEIHRFDIREHRVPSIAVSSDGRYAVTGGFDHTVRVWNVDGYAALLSGSPQGKMIIALPNNSERRG